MRLQLEQIKTLDTQQIRNREIIAARDDMIRRLTNTLQARREFGAVAHDVSEADIVLDVLSPKPARPPNGSRSP